MGRSRRLRIGEVRAVCRLVSECRELGDRLPDWRLHLTAGLRQQLGAVFAVAGELRPPGEPGPAFLSVDGCGAPLGPKSHAAWRQWVDRAEPQDHPAAYQLVVEHGLRHTRCRRQLLGDDDWYRSATYARIYEPHHVDDGIHSFFPMAGTGGFILNTCRMAGDRRYGGREVKLLHLVQQELAPHLGRSLATSSDPVSRLSPRMRQTLDCMLVGDSDKQAAARLGVSVATVREYVQVVYRRLGVESRAELLAQFLRRGRPLMAPPPAAKNVRPRWRAAD